MGAGIVNNSETNACLHTQHGYPRLHPSSSQYRFLTPFQLYYTHMNALCTVCYAPGKGAPATNRLLVGVYPNIRRGLAACCTVHVSELDSDIIMSTLIM